MNDTGNKIVRRLTVRRDGERVDVGVVVQASQGIASSPLSPPLQTQRRHPTSRHRHQQYRQCDDDDLGSVEEKVRTSVTYKAVLLVSRRGNE